MNQNNGYYGSKNKESLRLAAALAYSASDNAPKIVAVGQGHVADKIIEKAKEAGVPSVSNPEAAQILNTLNLGDEIPHELYNVVAQILAFVSDVDKLYAERKLSREKLGVNSIK